LDVASAKPQTGKNIRNTTNQNKHGSFFIITAQDSQCRFASQTNFTPGSD